MRKLNAREAREEIDRLLNAVVSGKEFVIRHRDKPVARLVAALPDSVVFTDRSGLQDSQPLVKESTAESVLTLRDDERY
ncbi:type II toxin-antitoxin system prevent-host-death family antitoxin [Marinobacter vulgaris]|uniref:Antitoxin n=1 Tax=Marinobacter vulgaris TaxID=1928331 RepID=A0A2V3ZGG9_9GAMM|nr:type II toxin-antitoxin system Phd/YefM family antitoxin [Marinobacter vulgaris]PXX88365.1 type II toxin-antitoxin system prevent-host-death family antitoxin [Marinobacter vulgaris]TSJ66061.1 type II toxin-antitoxin system prevent-host-death family antitoxin [Marinobacter vulgaris]